MLPDSVLIVDDEAIVLEVLSTAFQKGGLTVKTASRYADGITALRADPYGCLLVDKNLPDGNGLEMIRAARELQPFCACLVVTGYPNTASILEALRLGAVDYLEKPFPQLSIVVEKVRAAIGRQRIHAERDELARRVEALAAAPKPVQNNAEVVVAQQVGQQAQKALDEYKQRAQHELQELTTRLDAVKYRHGRALTALRQGSAKVSALIDKGVNPQTVDGELRELSRLLTSVLTEG